MLACHLALRGVLIREESPRDLAAYGRWQVPGKSSRQTLEAEAGSLDIRVEY